MKEFWKKFQRVPARRRRTKRDEERYCLALYLLARATYRKLKYPLRIEEGESPDFVVTWNSGKRTGLEVTKATNMWMQSEMTKADDEYERRQRAARDSGVEPAGVTTMLSDLGWAGDQAEAEWISFIRAAVERKLPKLAKFRATSRQDLLVYDDTPLPAIDRGKVLPVLSRWLSETRNTYRQLGRVSIIVSLDLLHDSGHDWKFYPSSTGRSRERHPTSASVSNTSARKRSQLRFGNIRRKVIQLPSLMIEAVSLRKCRTVPVTMCVFCRARRDRKSGRNCQRNVRVNSRRRSPGCWARRY